MKFLGIIFLSWLTFLSLQTHASSEICSQLALLEKVPTLQGGRVKPLLVHAKETMKFLTQQSSFQGIGLLEAYCRLHYESQGERFPVELTTKIEHERTKSFVGNFLTLEAGRAPFKALTQFSQEISREMMMQKIDSAYKKELQKLSAKIKIYNAIITGQEWSLPSFASSSLEWKSFGQFPELSTSLLTQMVNDYQREKGKKYLIELTYTKLNLFTWSIFSVLLALAFFVSFKALIPGLVMTFITIAIECVGVVMRIMISGRAPITNMYETVMFSGLGCLILVTIIGHFKKEKRFLLAGLSYNLCTLLMIRFANNMLSSSISPLVPVLRDNFWLSTHVTTIILAYSALGISWPLANYLLIKRKFGTLSSKDETYYNDLIYTCLKWGTVLLAAGTILGGVWADYSWGRFWGWDPKETWILIVLLIYMAILHGKYTSWISKRNFSFFTAGAFMSVMMAWFGVNYILASGLHSYGFSEGGAVFLFSFFVAQISVLFVCSDYFPYRSVRH